MTDIKRTPRLRARILDLRERSFAAATDGRMKASWMLARKQRMAEGTAKLRAKRQARKG